MKATDTSQLKASSYDRKACDIGIVHVGPGPFHRAHQACYVDAMMEQTGDLSWGIAGVNLRAVDSDYLQQLANSQDGYVLKTINANGDSDFRLVRSLISFADWSKDGEAAENLLAMSSVKMVTMTVTESGYYMDEDGRLNASHPVIKAELNGQNGSSLYAFLRAGLNRRRSGNAGPVTLACCDNLPGNGAVLKNNFYTYLEHCGDHDLLDWLNHNASFPSSMVDRITPKPDNRIFDEVAELLGRINDPAVLAEDFLQWVIEDDFAATRPPLGAVGVQIVESVKPYEETKIRVLNGGHTSLACLGVLRGHQTFDQAINDPVLLEHFLAFESNDVLSVLPDDLPFDKYQYLELVTARFRNPYVADSLRRICMDSVSKFSIYILPTVVDNFKNGRLPGPAIKSIASWYVFASRIVDGDLDFDYVEPNMALLEPYLQGGEPGNFTRAKELWGNLPVVSPEFSELLFREIEILMSEYPAAGCGTTSNVTARLGK